ncbi:MAG: trigger factor, partial [Bacteroidota bacterium]
KIIEKTIFDLPDDFLKRFIVLTDKKQGVTPENIEEHYPKYKEAFKWELIKNKIITDNNIQITEEEIFEYAKKIVRAQFLNYGLNYIPDEYLINYSNDLIKKPEEKSRIEIKIFEDKVIEEIKSKIKLTNKKVSMDEFNKLFEKDNALN